MARPLSVSHLRLYAIFSFKSPTGLMVFSVQSLLKPLFNTFMRAVFPVSYPGYMFSVPFIPASRLRKPFPKPSQSMLLPLALRKSLKCVWSLIAPPTDMLKLFSLGISLVFIRMNPPVKSAGYSGAGLFTITILSSCELGMMSNEKARESASELGTALPFIHTLLYRCDRPRTITNFSSMMLMPGTRRMTSEALLSWVLAICWAETPLCTTRLRRCSCMSATSLFRLACAVTETSPNACASLSNSKFSTVSALTFTLLSRISLYPIYLTAMVYVPSFTFSV